MIDVFSEQEEGHVFSLIKTMIDEDTPVVSSVRLGRCSSRMAWISRGKPLKPVFSQVDIDGHMFCYGLVS